MPTGRVKLKASTPEGLIGETEVTVEPGANVMAEISLKPGAAVSGRVLAADTREPLQNATIGAKPSNGAYSRTSADGRFRLDKLAPGPLTLSVWAQGYRPEQRPLTLSPGKTEELGDILLPKQ